MHEGHVDLVSRHTIIGWAANADQPDARLEVTILIDGSEYARVVADRPREGLRARGTYGDGRHGFEYVLQTPLSILRGYDVVVRFSDTKVVLPNGRRRLQPISRDSLTLQPVLVTATGRSGTTLLMRRLGNSPGLVIADAYPFEMKLLTYYARALEVLTAPGNREKSVTPETLYADPFHLGLNPFHHPDHENVFPRRDMLYAFFGHRTVHRLTTAFGGIISDFYEEIRAHQQRVEARFFAEKSDIFTTARDFARLAFEACKEIVLLRDPRDVHCSRQSFWSESAGDSLQNLRSVQARMLQIKEQDSDNLMFLRYEDLIQKPEQTMDDISRFLGLNQRIQINAASEQQVFSSHSTSRDPASSIGRWKSEMNTEEHHLFAREFRPFLAAFGYEGAPA